MADVFEWKKGLNPWREQLWQLIEETPFLDWLLLTKRPHLAQRLVPWCEEWPANVWLGTTVEDQKWVDKRLPHLVDCPARIRFLSCEPLLDEIDLRNWLEKKAIHWVIAGGESGARARPTDPQWFYALRDQCVSNNVPFHFKQWGDWAPLELMNGSLPRRAREESLSAVMGKFGKKASGRLLGDQTWDQLPT